MKFLLTLTMVALLGGVAQADDAFDPTGWKYLGGMAARKEEQKLHIMPSPYTGSISELAIVAQTGSAKVTKVELMQQGDLLQTLHLGTRVKAKGAALTFAVDAALIPIDGLAVTVSDVSDTKGTRLLVFGRDSSVAPREKVEWDHTGWIELAKGNVGYASPRLGSGEKTELAMLAIVPDAEIDLSNVEIKIDGVLPLRDAQVTALAPGEPYLVDLSNEPKPVVVAGVQMQAAVTGALETGVTVYGLPSTVKDGRPQGRVLRVPSKEQAAEADASKWEDLGWTLLGEDDVDLIDDEVVVPKKQKGTWSQVKVVVVGDAVQLRTLDLHLGGKKSKVQSEKLEQTYGEDDDSVVIAIPGKRRAIKKVRLQYKKHKLDASTRVQIYAR